MAFSTDTPVCYALINFNNLYISIQGEGFVFNHIMPFYDQKNKNETIEKIFFVLWRRRTPDGNENRGTEMQDDDQQVG